MDSLRDLGCRRRKSIINTILIGILLYNGMCYARSPLLQLHDNGYSNIVVGISNSIKNDVKLIEEIKNLLTTASQQLFIATKQHVYFKDITVILPSSWLQLELPIVKSATFESFEEADIKIEIPDRQNIPYTKQSSGCGQKGLSIHLSPDFILSARNKTNFTVNAKKLVREWAYYQYGVFEECGYENDALFPQFYYHHNLLEVSGCSQPHAHVFEGNCSVTSLSGIPGSECEFALNENITVSSSILYKPSMERIKYFCDDRTHNADAPTKQNFLCREKSAWTVIRDNPDLANTTPLSDANFNTTPTFRYVVSTNVTYVILLDQSNKMMNYQKFEAVQPVLARFITHHVPDGNVVALASFSDGATIIHPETLINDKISRAKVVSKIPGNVQIEEKADIQAGITTAADIFKPLSPMQLSRKVLILITAGRWLPTGIVEMCAKLKKVGARLVVIVCSDSDKPLAMETNIAIHQLANCSHGKVFSIPDILPNNYPLIVERLDAVMRASLFHHELEDGYDQILMKHFANGTDATLVGNFTIDENLSDSMFRVSYEKNKNLEEVTLTRPDGQTYDGVFDKDDLGPARIYHFNDVQLGLWKYEIKVYDVLQNSSVTVALNAKSKPNSSITVKCWTNVDVIDRESPVILYAEVLKTNAPIVQANVIATVYVPSAVPPISYQVQLYDSGNGDPDITENDGIYSRYLIHFPETGFYYIEVNVEGLDDGITRTYYSMPVNHEETSDCQKPIYRASFTGKFSRFAVGPSFYVPHRKPDITYPPNRISDLRIHKVDPSRKQIELQWTAAGEDLDWGKIPISNYQIHTSENRKQLELQHFDKANRVNATIAAIGNDKLSAVFNLKNDNAVHYFAIRTKDGQGLESDLSNIVSAFLSMHEAIPETKTDSSIALNRTEAPTKSASGARTGTIIGIVIAVVLVLVILIVVWRVTSNRRNRKKEQIHNSKRDYEQVPVSNESIKPVNEESVQLTTVSKEEKEKSEKSDKKSPKGDHRSSEMKKLRDVENEEKNKGDDGELAKAESDEEML